MISPATRSAIRAIVHRLPGRKLDWQLRTPAIPRPRPGRHWLGPFAVWATTLLPWFAFAGATGDGDNVAFGLYIGAVSIALMAWSFVLAIRIRALESWFGGLDSMYRVHRWAGTLAVIAMYLHTAIEPEIEGGIRGASRSLANTAEDLAGTGQTMLYILVGISLVRLIPYRFWRWTHKLLGIPFAFACFHFFTAEKPYANSSAWGWYFGIMMVAGLVAYVVRVVGRDMIARGIEYEVTAADVTGSCLALSLRPIRTPLRHQVGQFVVLKFQHRGLREPHIFSIASAPDDPQLSFFIRDLGDWTARLQGADLIGTRVLVEGPYGRFQPFGELPLTSPPVWVAGGVGVTPFLSAARTLPVSSIRPTLHYVVRSRVDAIALEELQVLQNESRLDLVVYSSDDDNRFAADALALHHGKRGLLGRHVAVCGPASLVSVVVKEARAAGADHVEREDFDIRQGFGPDLSREIDAVLPSLATAHRTHKPPTG